MSCTHDDFMVRADVVKISAVEGGPIVAYSVELHIKCVQCEESFEFMGIPIGWQVGEPAASVDGEEARMPIRPMSAPPGFGEDLTSWHVEVREG